MTQENNHPAIIRTYDVILTGNVTPDDYILHRFLVFANLLNLTVLNSSHQFFPTAGLSAVVVLAESHISIHTWPNERRAYLNIVTCGPFIRDTVLRQALLHAFPNLNAMVSNIVKEFDLIACAAKELDLLTGAALTEKTAL